MKPLELAGNRYGALVVIGRVESSGRHVRWACMCDCGKDCSVVASNLTSGHSITCGAPHHRAKPAGTKKTAHPAYQVWREMRRRCGDPRATSYPRYGGRGGHGVRRMGQFREVHCRHGRAPVAEAPDRPNRRQRGLLQGQLQVGHGRREQPQPELREDQRCLRSRNQGIAFRWEDVPRSCQRHWRQQIVSA